MEPLDTYSVCGESSVADEVDGYRRGDAIAGKTLSGFGPDRHLLGLQAHHRRHVQ